MPGEMDGIDLAYSVRNSFPLGNHLKTGHT
jgi:hypothetical protein